MVKILMEFCEGGSLVVIRERITKLGLAIEENVVGRLAEGVMSRLACPAHVYAHTRYGRYCKVFCISAPRNLFVATSNHPTYC